MLAVESAATQVQLSSTEDPSPSNRFNINRRMFRNGVGYTLNLDSGYVTPNYPAILTWIKSGPQTLPPNLRAGRVVYYTAIPSDVVASGSTEDQLNKIFWRNYIDYVLALSSNYRRERFLAGSEPLGWPEGTTPQINQNSFLGIDEGSTSSRTFIQGTPRYKGYDPDGRPNNVRQSLPNTTTLEQPTTPLPAPTPTTGYNLSTNGIGNGANNYSDTHADIRNRPRMPYMHYLDNPSRPRMHFWFGPQSMMDFLHNVRDDSLNPDTSPDGRENMWAGTIHEAQAWQLKVGIKSTLDDIRNNHPNDFCGLSYFAYPNFRTIRAPMSQDFVTTKNTLFYPHSIVPQIPTNPTLEVRPYNTSFQRSSPGVVSTNPNIPTYTANTVIGNYPVASGATDPNSGLALAYNLHASNASLNADANKRGRRGAVKFTIFETDGVPSAATNWQFNATGYDSTYSYVNAGAWVGSGQTAATGPALSMVTQITKPVAFTNGGGTDHGFSLPSAPARVYAIGFGDLFSTPSATQQTAARQFLLNVQQNGKTSSVTDPAIPAEQIITGNYQTRIDNLQFVLERIMQSGVQVTLIE